MLLFTPILLLIVSLHLIQSASVHTPYNHIVDDDNRRLVDQLDRQMNQIRSFNSMLQSKTKPCVELVATNVTFSLAVAKSTMTLVNVVDDQQFTIAECSNRMRPRCTGLVEPKNSICVTKYQWMSAKTITDDDDDGQWTDDKILLPSGCVCVLGGGMMQQQLDAPLIID